MKTIEEFIEENAFEIVHKEFPTDDNWTNEICCEIGIRKGVEFAQRWISVEEELPEKSQRWHNESNSNYKYYDYVICKTKNRKYLITRRYQFLDHVINWAGSGALQDSITHWRPIELK